MGAGAGVCGCVDVWDKVVLGTFSLTQSKHRQTDRWTDGQTGAYSAVLPVGFPSPCPASETPSASAPPRLRDTCDGSPSADREEGKGGRGKEGIGGVKKDKKRKENQSRSSIQTCFSQR